MKNKFVTAISMLTVLLGSAMQLEAANNQNESSYKNRAQQNPELLFIQTAEEAVITADPRAKDQYILTLRNVKPQIAYFTDKPKRLAGKVSIEKFLARWNEEGNESFKNQSHLDAIVQEAQIIVSQALGSAGA